MQARVTKIVRINPPQIERDFLSVRFTPGVYKVVGTDSTYMIVFRRKFPASEPSSLGWAYLWVDGTGYNAELVCHDISNKRDRRFVSSTDLITVEYSS